MIIELLEYRIVNNPFTKLVIFKGHVRTGRCQFAESHKRLHLSTRLIELTTNVSAVLHLQAYKYITAIYNQTRLTYQIVDKVKITKQQSYL